MWCARFRILLGSTDKVDGMFTCSYRNAGSVLAAGKSWKWTLFALGVLVGQFIFEGIAAAQVSDAIAHWRFDEG